MKRIANIKRSNLDRHFVKTEKRKKHFSVSLSQHVLVCLKFYFTSIVGEQMWIFRWNWSPGFPCKGVQIRQSFKDPSATKHLYLEFVQYNMDGIDL